jgi:peptidase M1-like protein
MFRSLVALAQVAVAILLAPCVAAAAEKETPVSDPNYQALRDAVLVESYLVENLEFQRDLGKFVLKFGHLSFPAPVLGRVTMAVFTGDGEFSAAPSQATEKRSVKNFTEKEEVRELFRRAVFIFTDDTYEQWIGEASPAGLDAQAARVLADYRGRMRQRREEPLSQFDAMLRGEDIDNVDADVLTDLYNPAQRGAFSAYMFGQAHDDLRFHLRPRGGLPQLDANEEVAVLNVLPRGMEEGAWYLSHTQVELAAGGPDAAEDHRVIDVLHYSIETEIAENRDLTGRCRLRFRPLVDGARVLKFGLLPNLRVTEARMPEGEAIIFIQEPKRKDGSLYVVFPEGLSTARDYELELSYDGEKVVTSAGGGNFYVAARTSWYPSVNRFRDRATFDLSFQYPKKYTLVSVGARGEEGKDGKMATSKWSSDVPLAVAGFNLGRFKQKQITDERTGYEIEGFAASTLPDWLRAGDRQVQLPTEIPGRRTIAPSVQASPTKMMERTMSEARASIQLFTYYYGLPPYGRIAITQQPQTFGQSWPSLVYLSMLAFLDGTQRWMLFSSSPDMIDFVREITPHEVAHQWWGHMVGWRSYRDQWLSEGFADFSAGLFLQQALRDTGKFREFVRAWRENILEKNEFGFSANDVGPISMGLRLTTPRASQAYSRVVYSKGGYTLHMLRQMMHSGQQGDAAFIAMMKDFVATYLHQDASTADFQRIVEKHITRDMDVEQNGTVDWFFNQWVHGIEVPSYRFEYQLVPQDGQQTKLLATISQTGVSDTFKMPVPVYVQFGDKVSLLGRMVLAGTVENHEIQVTLPQKPDRVMINYYHDILAHSSESVEKGGS